MKNYIGTTENIINWDIILTSLSSMSGNKITGIEYLDNLKSISKTKYKIIKELWDMADYNFNNIVQYNYHPNMHFDSLVEKKFERIVNATHRYSYISEVMPGQFIPYHYDLLDYDENTIRYICFITEPHCGDLVFLKEDCYSLIGKNTIFRWDNHQDYYALTNAGNYPQYLYHFYGDSL